MRYFATIAAAAVLAAFAALAAAVPAGAGTSFCAQGVYAGSCGTQVSGEANPLAWDVYQQHATIGNRIIAYPDDAGDRATDFYWFAYNGGANKIAEYAPDGVASNLCVTEPARNAGLLLETCTGSANQQFTATTAETGSTLTDAATGNIITDPAGLRSQLAGIAEPQTLTGADEWSFQG